MCLGYRRQFSSFAEAQSCASKFIRAGHEHPDELRFHTTMSDTIRESDYPVLFYLAPIAHELNCVFDFGGNVGNLFYSYQRQITFPDDFTWTVFDIPMKKPIGEQLAVQRREPRIRFTDTLANAGSPDAFIASGSLHYFEDSLDSLLRQITALPKHVFVNRTPFSTGGDLVTVQDNHSYLAPCKLHSRRQFIAGMEHLGYSLIAEWPVHERKLAVPLYPDLSAHSYSGFYFRKL
jgi:putative methyltransferase (TIGR04325 family)